MMSKMADAVIALPGGTGTFEELFEIITWKMLGLFVKPVIILNRQINDGPCALFNPAASDQG